MNYSGIANFAITKQRAAWHGLASNPGMLYAWNLPMKAFLTPFLALILTSTAIAGNGGGMKTPATSPTATPATTTAAPAASVPSGDPQRSGQVKQIETFVRSVLPAIIATESGDESNLGFLKDKVTYFDTLQQRCTAAKAGHVETTAVIKKLDPSDITIDTVKNEARVNVMGNLSLSGTASPTLWVVSVKINPAGSPQPFAVSQIIAAKLPAGS